ncbi:MAG: hypothetical protein WCJ58_01685 [bacterium]
MSFFSPAVISTQEHLEIEDVIDDLVVLKSGMVSLVMKTTALNFELLSEKEQDAKILSFAGLLNSLNFQMQIVIKTERTDVSSYIERLKEYRSTQISKALQKQIDIYINFINNLTRNREVLAKHFYVVIPEVIGEVQRTSLIKQLFGKKTKIINKHSLVERAKVQLYPKRDHLTKQFKKMGLIASQLNKQELVRLYYTMYDPDKLGTEHLDLTTNEITTSLITQKTNSPLNK